MELSGPEIEEIFEALLDAFRSYNELERMVMFKLTMDLNNIVGINDNMKDVVYKLIKCAKSSGKLEKLIKGAYEQNSGNIMLQKIQKNITLSLNQLAFFPLNSGKKLSQFYQK